MVTIQIKKILVTSSLLVTALFQSPVLFSQEDTQEEALAVFSLFLSAMTASDKKTVQSLFADDAFFWGTGSKTLVTNPSGISEYFSTLDKNAPNSYLARPLNYEIKNLSPQLVLISGMWEIENVTSGTITPLRISMALENRDDSWQIVQFHNSAVP